MDVTGGGAASRDVTGGGAASGGVTGGGAARGAVTCGGSDVVKAVEDVGSGSGKTSKQVFNSDSGQLN
jgi:hypothetical protein